MAAVYEARTRDAERVAVKVLHAELATVNGVRTRFLREAQVANRIEHDGVVRMRDAGEEDGIVYLVMDLLEGRTLEAELRARGGTLPAPRAFRVTADVLAVLSAAHEKGIVHRDVKPANVFLTTADDVRVLDFGLARRIGDSRSTPVGDLVGTADFMSPEQARGRNAEVDARSDVFSVGAMSFTMITGELVHASGSPVDRLIAAATRQARTIRSVCPDVPDAVAHVVDMALWFDPNDRWASAAEMRTAVLEALRGTTGAAQ